MARLKRLQGDYSHLPGLREHLRAQFEPDVIDARLYLLPESENMTHAELMKLSEPSVSAQSARRTVQALDDGETVTVARWYVGGNQFPEARRVPWIADRSAPYISVDRFDRLAPVTPLKQYPSPVDS